jgi:hypothetical protein
MTEPTKESMSTQTSSTGFSPGFKTLACIAAVMLGFVAHLYTPAPDHPAESNAAELAKAHAEMVAQCKEVFDLNARYSRDDARLSGDDGECQALMGQWAKALAPTLYSTTGSALLLNGSAYSLAGASIHLDSLTWGTTTLPTVEVSLSKFHVTLRFQNASQADAALKNIAEAMGRAHS